MYAKITVAVLVSFLLAGCGKIERALSCPEGQHTEIAYYIPITHFNPDNTTWTQMMPVYECRSN